MSQFRRQLPWLLMSLSAAIALPAPASAKVEAIATRIFKIEAPHDQFDGQLFTTKGGRVFFVTDAKVLASLEAFNHLKRPVKLLVEKETDTVVGAKELSKKETRGFSDGFNPEAVAAAAVESEAVAPPAATDSETGLPMPKSYNAALALGYQPTRLSTPAEAQALFKAERNLDSDSQCYERAHVWAKEWENARGIKSMKVFMFFTNNFRWRYTSKNWIGRVRPYKWWFHVAPFVYVGNQEYVMDQEFLWGNSESSDNGAVPMNDWTYHFIGKVSHNSSHANPTYQEAICRDADRYSEYGGSRTQPEYCILRKVPMYYFQPLDVENLDCQPGSTPTSCRHSVVDSWRQWELNKAYRNTRF